MGTLFALQLYPSTMASYLIQSKCSINTCWANQWMDMATSVITSMFTDSTKVGAGGGGRWGEEAGHQDLWPSLSWKERLSQNPLHKFPLHLISQNWLPWRAPLLQQKMLKSQRPVTMTADSYPRPHQDVLSQGEAASGYELHNQSFHPQVVWLFPRCMFYFYFIYI